MLKKLLVALLFGFLTAPSVIAAPIEVHFAPTENLEHIDAGLLRGATRTIDIAAYVMTDWPVIDALVAARARGVTVRVVLDPSQHHAIDKIALLADVVRMKRSGAIMHLKGYVLDERVVRTGSANFSASGLKQQDNDIVVIEDAAIAAKFKQNFERIWDEATPMVAASAPIAPSPAGLLTAPIATPQGSATAAQPSSQCLIKGNVNRKGERIFHMPDQLDYGRVVMEGHPEKRWFCSEEEAVVAGWRKAMR